jgi:hypothetical protein
MPETTDPSTWPPRTPFCPKCRHPWQWHTEWYPDRQPIIYHCTWAQYDPKQGLVEGSTCTCATEYGVVTAGSLTGASLR